jgi:hypothetical protein
MRKAVFFIALSMSLLPGVQASRLHRELTSRASTGEKSKDSVASSTSPTSAKRIGAVVSALQDLLASIESEEKEEAQQYKCYVQWCDDTIAAKKQEIDENQIALENNRVAAEQHTSKLATTKYAVEKNKEETEEQTDALAEATEIRNEENKKFTEDDTLMKQNIKQLETAIKIVSKANAVNFLMQKGGGKGRAPGESNFILGTFKGLLENLNKNLGENAAEEAKKQENFDKLAATKNAQLLALRDDTEKKLISIGETKQDLAAAKNAIDDLTDALSEDKKFLSKTESACGDKKKAWTIRSADRAAEKAAIREAISFLVVSFKEPSLLQTHPHGRGQSGYSLLQARVSEHSRASSADVAIAMLDDTDAELSSTSSDDNARTKQQRFDDVKKMLTDLIAVMQKEQKEEKAKKEMCEAELEKKGDEKDKTSDSVDMLKANIESKTNEVSTLAEEVKEIKRLIAESKKADELAAKLRQDARKTYKTGMKDRKMTIKVLHSAMAVLQKFYNSQDAAAMVQKRAEKVMEGQPPSFDEGSTRRGVMGNIVISMLEKIVGDVQKEQKDAEIAENQAESEFQESLRENAEMYESRMEEITQKVIRKARLKVQLGDQKETLEEQEDKFDSVVAQIKALHDDCDELIKFYDKRTKDRNFEISQIRDVFDILSGSSVAARTGLVQDSDDDLTEDPEENQLQDMLRTTKDIAGKVHQLKD